MYLISEFGSWNDWEDLLTFGGIFVFWGELFIEGLNIFLLHLEYRVIFEYSLAIFQEIVLLELYSLSTNVVFTIFSLYVEMFAAFKTKSRVKERMT